MIKSAIKQFSVASLTAAFLFCVGSATASAGTRAYDISPLLFEPHPFDTQAPMPPVVAQPVPAPQPVAPAPPAPGPYYSQPYSQPYAQPTAPQPAPPSPAPARSSRQAAAAPASSQPEGLGGFLSEIRIGVLAHDIGPFSRNEEGGVDANFEMLFVSPDILDVIWSPRPHFGFTVNSEGNTNQVYAGLTYQWSFFRDWFWGFSMGGAYHDGYKATDQVDRKELGCSLLFRGSVEVGYKFADRHSISGFLDHISNANICDHNEGLETSGIRYGYSF